MGWQETYRELTEEYEGEFGRVVVVCQPNHGRRIAMSPARGILADLDHPTWELLEDFATSLSIPVFSRLKGDEYYGPGKTYKD